MKRFKLIGPGVLVLLGGILGILPAQDTDEERPYGIYSNMQISMETGDVSGFEFFILPSNEGDYIIFQNAEGWPNKPLILEVQLGGSTVSDHNMLRFTHPEMGPFVGKIEKGRLIGEFSDMRYTIELSKGRSIWQ